MKKCIKKLNILAWASLFSLVCMNIATASLFGINADFEPLVESGKKLCDKLSQAHDIYFDLEPINDNMSDQEKGAAEQRNKDKKAKKLEEINLKDNLEQLKEFVKEIWKEDVDPALSGFKNLKIKKRWGEDVQPVLDNINQTVFWIKIAAICIALTTVGKALYQLAVAKDNKDVRRGLRFLYNKYKRSSKRSRSRRYPLKKENRQQVSNN